MPEFKKEYIALTNIMHDNLFFKRNGKIELTEAEAKNLEGKVKLYDESVEKKNEPVVPNAPVDVMEFIPLAVADLKSKGEVKQGDVMKLIAEAYPGLLADKKVKAKVDEAVKAALK